MKDKDLYQQILGIQSPWRVIDVDLQHDEQAVDVFVDIEAGAELCCPECGRPCPGYDRRKRRWRHLDTCQYKTMLHADVPRVNCPTHGIHQVHVPWAEPGSGFTAMFEALVIDWLKETTPKAIVRQMDVTWSAIDGIMQRAVKRGLERREEQSPKRLSVDETSFRKRHDYVTLVSDQHTGHVLYVGDDRTGDTLKDYYNVLSDEKKEAIESVAMDMWPAYINATIACIPEAAKKICFDKFHVAQYLGDAVDKVRRMEQKELREIGDNSLVGSKFLWLKNPNDMEAALIEKLDQLRKAVDKTSRAWGIKEMAMGLWHYVSRTWAEEAWKRWLGWAIRCRLEPVVKVARMIRDHLWGIVNAVVKKVSNASAESINSKIKLMKVKARGYRNKERFRNAIYFHLGGLDLYPAGLPKERTHTNP